MLMYPSSVAYYAKPDFLKSCVFNPYSHHNILRNFHIDSTEVSGMVLYIV